MKTLKMLVLVVAITFSSAISASTNPVENAEPNSVTATIAELLKNPKFEFYEGMSANVELAVNEDNELVVLSVTTESKVFETFIKNRLNYKKIPKAVTGNQKTFKVPVRLTKSK